MAYEVIHLTPTLDTSAYADNDILFSAEAIKLPARSCKILAMQATWDTDQAGDEELLVCFHRENVQVLGGAANAASAATSALLRPDSGSLLGFLRLSNDSTVEGGLGTPLLLISGGQKGDDSAEFLGPNPPLVVASGTEAHKIYVSALLEVSGGVTTHADDLDIFIHVEY